MKIGILGGTFDPIHLGHLRIAEEAGQVLHLQKVCLIPSASPPHKTKHPVSPFHHRLAMARLGAAISPLLDVLDLEGQRPGFSYSIETLKKLNHIYRPEPDLYFIIGTDAFLEIETWKNYQNLFDYAHFAVVRRSGHKKKNLEPFLMRVRDDIQKAKAPRTYVSTSKKTIKIMNLTIMGISSTDIRQMVGKKQSIRFLVPETVREYISSKGLYNHNANH